MRIHRSDGRGLWRIRFRRLWCVQRGNGFGAHCAWKINVFPANHCNTGCQNEDGEVEKAGEVHAARGVRSAV
jgi:hypothetical protein